MKKNLKQILQLDDENLVPLSKQEIKNTNGGNHHPNHPQNARNPGLVYKNSFVRLFKWR